MVVSNAGVIAVVVVDVSVTDVAVSVNIMLPFYIYQTFGMHVNNKNDHIIIRSRKSRASFCFF